MVEQPAEEARDEAPSSYVDNTGPSKRERKRIRQYVKETCDHRLYQIIDPYQDRDGQGPTVNLLVGGTLVCGTVCSAREWAIALNDIHESGAGATSTLLTGWADEFQERSDAYRQAWETEDAALTNDAIDARWAAIPHVHLVDAYVMLSAGTPAPSTGMPYRVRLNEVQAWGLGSLSLGQAT
ncbi:hypothetical protein [Microlunatus soli]|uniref:Uncharacterized protein n=1 Tax=Microlunatus soli TaxID=630515 RepID=A0A1H1N9A9_9ACTN|nr:hypothetical protein [Microlunatus soli]SDR95508.1 hypothetical protein SAMN04489812_0431 [Microlunatus soli]